MKRPALILSLILLILLIQVNAGAEPTRIRATCYLPTGHKTATGITPYEGVIACNRSRLGQRAAVYAEDMTFIGYFICEDTGGHAGLKNGTRIDVFRDSRESLNEWVSNYGDYVYMEWVEDEDFTDIKKPKN